MADNRPTASLRLMLTHPTGGDEQHRTSLRIVDDASMITVADIELSPEQFTALLSNRGDVHVEARIPGPLGQPRLFRKREAESRPVPPEVGDKWDYRRGSEVTARVDEWAARIKADEGWDAATVETGSQTFYVRLLRWLSWEESFTDGGA